MDIIAKTKKEIKEIKIQGATAVARAVVLSLKLYAKGLKVQETDNFKVKLSKAAQDLLSVRPTEPLAQNATGFLFWKIAGEKDVKKAKNNFIKSADEILDVIAKAKAKASTFAGKLISQNNNIFTHCHSSLVEASFLAAKKQGKNFNVFNTETRPLFQGHITAKNLLKNKIPVTMVTDSSAEFLISRHSGKDLMMDKVFIGSDAVLRNGSCINKIGSFGIGLAAHSEKMPLYVVTSLLKFTNSSWIKIEKRPAKEVWEKAPDKLRIINFAFDIVPANFITAIVCEAGVIKPSQVKEKVEERYPWIIKGPNFKN